MPVFHHIRTLDIYGHRFQWQTWNWDSRSFWHSESFRSNLRLNQIVTWVYHNISTVNNFLRVILQLFFPLYIELISGVGKYGLQLFITITIKFLECLRRFEYCQINPIQFTQKLFNTLPRKVFSQFYYEN